jgi:ribose 5-phosphate isomerase A
LSTSVKIEDSMVLAANTIAADHIASGMIVGLGSGSAVSKFARALGELVKKGSVKNIAIVPSSMQAWLLAKQNFLALYSDSAHCPDSLDAAVDGADQISLGTRSMIKGGGGALLREKIILSASKRSYILAESPKLTDILNRPIPVEVVQFAISSVQKQIAEDFGSAPILRTLEKGYPFYTESGNVILDCGNLASNVEPRELERSLKFVPGVVEVGVFNCKVDRFYIGSGDGSFKSH